MSLIKLSARAATLALAVLSTSPAISQTYPNRDITFIVPYSPGGSTDPLSRQFSTQLAKELNATVNVENRLPDESVGSTTPTHKWAFGAFGGDTPRVGAGGGAVHGGGDGDAGPDRRRGAAGSGQLPPTP